MSNSHRDYEPFEMGENMEEDLGLFQAAVQPRCDEIPSPIVKRFLVVNDGSNQVDTTKRIAQSVAKHSAAEAVEILLLDNALSVSKRTECILGHEANVDLTVLPVPVGEDILDVSSQSLGAVADVLLASHGKPLLCVRQPMPAIDVDSMWQTVIVAVSSIHPKSMEAVGWAFLMATKKIILLEWVDQESLTEAQQLLEGRKQEGSIQHAMVERAVSSRLGPLVGKAQRRATSDNIALHVEFRLGNPCRQILEAKESYKNALVVIGGSQNTISQNQHLIEDLLRASRTPILVV